MKTRRVLLVLATMAALLSLALFAGVVSAEPDHPPPRRHHRGFVRWEPRILHINGEPGETVTEQVTFSSTIALSDITVRVSRPLSHVITISPATFTDVMTGENETLEIEITLPDEPNARRGYGGDIILMSGRRPIPLPLPVLVRVAREE